MPKPNTDSLLGFGLSFTKSASGQSWEDAPDGKGIYVSAIAQAEVEDLQKEVLTYQGSKKAFADWPGAVTDLHGGPDAGYATTTLFDDEKKQIVVKSRITAPETIARVKKSDDDPDRLRGYSVEGKRVAGRTRVEKGVRITDEWRLAKLALVPNPALPQSELSICKSAVPLGPEVPLEPAQPAEKPESFKERLDKALSCDVPTPALDASDEPTPEDIEKAGDAAEKPYGDVTYADPGYQKDGKKRYPVDTAKHIRAAWSYIGQDKNAAKYSGGQVKKIKSKIVAAWKKTIDKKGPPGMEKSADGPRILKYYPGGDETDDIGWGIDALRLLQMLRAREAAEEDEDETEGIGYLDTAITAVKQFIASEGMELAAEGSGECAACGCFCEGCSFCPDCGAEMATSDAEKSATPRKRTTLLTLLSGVSKKLEEIEKAAPQATTLPKGLFVQEDGLELAKSLVGSVNGISMRLEKATQDRQAEVSAAIAKVNDSYERILKLPWPGNVAGDAPIRMNPTTIEKQAAETVRPGAAPGVPESEVLFRAASMAPTPEMRAYLNGQAAIAVKKEQQ